MISLLLPTFFPRLAERLIRSICNGAKDDYEIVVCSPQEVNGDQVVWVKDDTRSGNNPATRAAFKASRGDVVACLNDRILLSENWKEKALSSFASDESALWGLSTQAGRCSCFGLYYPFYPMARRSLIEDHWKSFYPYTAHWGDVALACSVWKCGGKVKETSEYIIVETNDRMGEPEAPHKSSAFDNDLKRFLEDFKDLGNGWDLSNWRNFNR